MYPFDMLYSTPWLSKEDDRSENKFTSSFGVKKGQQQPLRQSLGLSFQLPLNKSQLKKLPAALRQRGFSMQFYKKFAQANHRHPATPLWRFTLRSAACLENAGAGKRVTGAFSFPPVQIPYSHALSKRDLVFGHRHRRACAPLCAQRPATKTRGGKTRHWRVFFSARSNPLFTCTKQEGFGFRASSSLHLRSALRTAACHENAGRENASLARFLFRPFKSLIQMRQTKGHPFRMPFCLAEKEGFEPSRQLPQPTPLAGEPL